MRGTFIDTCMAVLYRPWNIVSFCYRLTASSECTVAEDAGASIGALSAGCCKRCAVQQSTQTRHLTCQAVQHALASSCVAPHAKSRHDTVYPGMQTGLDASLYTYFVFMNSSIRGPFLPAHWPPQV